MKMKLKLSAIALVSSLATGCVSTTSVMQMGPNTFTVSATADGMRPATHAREQALQLANEKCAGMKKTIRVVSEKSEATRLGIDTTYTLNFACE